MCEVVKHQACMKSTEPTYMKFANQFQGASCSACPVFPFLFGTTNTDFWWLGTLQPKAHTRSSQFGRAIDEH